MSIVIGADIVPTNSNIVLFEEPKVEKLLDNGIQTLLNNADFRIFNLEVPLTDKKNKINKNGPHLIASTKSIAGMKAIGVNLFTLANNHIMDQDVQGLQSTIEVLNRAGIAYVGAGSSIGEARKPYIISLKGKHIGIYACTEHEFSVAGEKTYGANPFDPLESLDDVGALKKQCDYVIVLYHGGKELYRYPSPYLQKVCRKLVEKGANLVVCQHSHCIGCEEDYKNGKIIYGQGNFIFDGCDNEYWQNSILIEIKDDYTIAYHPLIKTDSGVSLAKNEYSINILSEMKKRTEEIKKPDFIEREYRDFAKGYLSDYVIEISGMKRPFLYKVANRLLGQKLDLFRIRKYLIGERLKMINYIECEAHRELLLKGLKEYHDSKC